MYRIVGSFSGGRVCFFSLVVCARIWALSFFRSRLLCRGTSSEIAGERDYSRDGVSVVERVTPSYAFRETNASAATAFGSSVVILTLESRSGPDGMDVAGSV